MTRLDRVTGLAVALAMTVGMAWLSNARLAPERQGDALLRLSWSARPERVETCRTQTAEELAKLPAHMRQSVICEGGSAVYRLQVLRDGIMVLDELVHGGGLRHDRPLYIFREIPQHAGDAVITVRLERVDPAPGAGGSASASSGPHSISDLPRSLQFERRLHFGRDRVILVTYDPERREFVAAQG
jgi:hypothetical protein